MILCFSAKSHGNLLDWHALEEQIHACAAHDDEARYHTSIDDIFDPFLATGNSNQSKADAALDGDESETPWFLKDVEPLLTDYYKSILRKGGKTYP